MVTDSVFEPSYAEIARIAYEATRGFRDLVPTLSATPPWASASFDVRHSYTKQVEYYFEDAGRTTTTYHNLWKADQVGNGWVYGAEFDAEAKTAPTIRAWADLDWKYRNLRTIVKGVVDALRSQMPSQGSLNDPL